MRCLRSISCIFIIGCAFLFLSTQVHAATQQEENAARKILEFIDSDPRMAPFRNFADAVKGNGFDVSFFGESAAEVGYLALNDEGGQQAFLKPGQKLFLTVRRVRGRIINAYFVDRTPSLQNAFSELANQLKIHPQDFVIYSDEYFRDAYHTGEITSIDFSYHRNGRSIHLINQRIADLVGDEFGADASLISGFVNREIQIFVKRLRLWPTTAGPMRGAMRFLTALAEFDFKASNSDLSQVVKIIESSRHVMDNQDLLRIFDRGLQKMLLLSRWTEGKLRSFMKSLDLDKWINARVGSPYNRHLRTYNLIMNMEPDSTETKSEVSQVLKNRFSEFGINSSLKRPNKLFQFFVRQIATELNHLQSSSPWAQNWLGSTEELNIDLYNPSSLFVSAVRSGKIIIADYVAVSAYLKLIHHFKHQPIFWQSRNAVSPYSTALEMSDIFFDVFPESVKIGIAKAVLRQALNAKNPADVFSILGGAIGHHHFLNERILNHQDVWPLWARLIKENKFAQGHISLIHELLNSVPPFERVFQRPPTQPPFENRVQVAQGEANVNFLTEAHLQQIERVYPRTHYQENLLWAAFLGYDAESLERLEIETQFKESEYKKLIKAAGRNIFDNGSRRPPQAGGSAIIIVICKEKLH